MSIAALVAIAHQPRLLQDNQMLGNGRLRYSSMRREGTDRLLPFAAQSLEDCSPAGVGEGSEEHVLSIVHSQSITR